MVDCRESIHSFYKDGTPREINLEKGIFFVIYLLYWDFYKHGPEEELNFLWNLKLPYIVNQWSFQLKLSISFSEMDESRLCWKGSCGVPIPNKSVLTNIPNCTSSNFSVKAAHLTISLSNSPRSNVWSSVTEQPIIEAHFLEERVKNSRNSCGERGSESSNCHCHLLISSGYPLFFF